VVFGCCSGGDGGGGGGGGGGSGLSAVFYSNPKGRKGWLVLYCMDNNFVLYNVME